ncbi:phosphotransferase [Kocuria massiliensis]|uniref:phosphotransferase n=1 Tax=Kocuria massiliensis TaxID=1926282 RepID=UPI0022B958F3|nr:phosphotransferase [Kocuria massiliensis]
MASAGVPGLFPVAASPYEDDNPDYTSAVVVDSARQRWIVRAPQNHEASVRLESEHVILHSFSPGLRARLPFQLPTVVGSATSQGLQSFVYPEVPGEVLDIEELARRSHVVTPERDPLATQLGKVIATIHTLPAELVQDADLPMYSHEQCRKRMLSELDRAASTGKVPSALLRRWEAWLEDESMWQFRPTVVHGDLTEDNLVLDGTRLSAVRGWHDLHVGDPSLDFSWLMSCPDQEFADAIIEVYSVQLPHAPDRYLLRRAYLHAEFAIAQWLVRAHERQERETVREAVAMLETLEEDLRAAGAIASPGTHSVPAKDPSAATPTTTRTSDAPGRSTVAGPGASTARGFADRSAGPQAPQGRGDADTDVTTDLSPRGDSHPAGGSPSGAGSTRAASGSADDDTAHPVPMSGHYRQDGRR